MARAAHYEMAREALEKACEALDEAEQVFKRGATEQTFYDSRAANLLAVAQVHATLAIGAEI